MPEEPLIGVIQALTQTDPGRPSHIPDPAHIQQLAWRAVGPAGVKDDLAVETSHRSKALKASSQ